MTPTLAIGVVLLCAGIRFAASVAAIIVWSGAVCAAVMLAGAFLAA